MRRIERHKGGKETNEHQTSANTYQKISKITPEQVVARIAKADKRFVAASNAATKTHYRHEGAHVKAPEDVTMPELPTVPGIPDALYDVMQGECLPSAQKERRREEGTFGWRSCIFHRMPIVTQAATPAQLVAAIKAADEYATQAEQISRDYLASVEAAIGRHVAAQVEAVNELAGLVAQS